MAVHASEASTDLDEPGDKVSLLKKRGRYWKRIRYDNTVHCVGNATCEFVSDRDRRTSGGVIADGGRVVSGWTITGSSGTASGWTVSYIRRLLLQYGIGPW
jgi:hypothetical protein